MGSPVFVAVAVVACVDAGDGLLDLLEQLALAVAGAQLQGMFFFDGGAVSRIGHDHGVLAQVLGGLTGVGQDAVLELDQLVAEESELHIVHVLAFRHGQHVLVGQFLRGLGFPVVGQLGVFARGFLHSGRHGTSIDKCQADCCAAQACTGFRPTTGVAGRTTPTDRAVAVAPC